MSKCWYCNNELTTGDNPKHFGICNKCYDEMFKSGDTIIRSLTNKIAELQKQLAEKYKEISNLNGLVRERDKQIKNLKTNKKRVIEHKNKTKISFAVEQLEKVKEKALHFYVNDTPKLTGFYIDVDEIDNQIEELKKEK